MNSCLAFVTFLNGEFLFYARTVDHVMMVPYASWVVHWSCNNEFPPGIIGFMGKLLKDMRTRPIVDFS